jgi:hypothetical protein
MMHGGSQGSMPSELGMLADDSPYLQEDSSGEGEQSHFGRAKKSKRKAAPRTSRACCEYLHSLKEFSNHWWDNLR